jgi:hypothetical protein
VIARMDSPCGRCATPIQIGDEITKNDEGYWCHPDCSIEDAVYQRENHSDVGPTSSAAYRKPTRFAGTTLESMGF